MQRKCGLHHRDGWHNHLTVKLGAASAADVPSDQRHPRIPRQHAPVSGSTLMSFGISLQVRLGYVFRVIACVQYALCTKLSYRRGTARYAISVEILSTTAHCTKNRIWKCLQWVNLKIIQGHPKWRDSIGHNHFYSLVAVTASCFPDIATFRVYVITCDFEKFLSFDTSVEITGNTRFPILLTKSQSRDIRVCAMSSRRISHSGAHI